MQTTLDGWAALQAVVRLGGFAAAAERLNRSQSTISYAIARLQRQLGVKLFEMNGRRAHLTEVGRLLLADAEPHLAGFRDIEQRARSIASGGDIEVRLSVDSIFPNDRLFAALAEFTRLFPHVRPKLRQGTFLSADDEFSGHNAQLCVTGLMSRELFVQPILDIRMLAVACRDHALHARGQRLSPSHLMQRMLVTIEGLAAGTVKHQPRSPAQRFMSVSTIEAAIDAVRSGLCFGWLPRYRIQPFIDSGELRALALSTGGTRDVRLNLVCKELTASSRELQTLADLFGLGRAPEVI